ncbi:zinc-RING finger domain [Phytophthora infestans]|uniref:Zinc-RING finger domain n=1 Tax=Phytophthora infestans TaxID=4787 RepID=A0A8S9V8R0_PHYIN|nr:zinc-RING finger domain [Phytophthora infestans]
MDDDSRMSETSSVRHRGPRRASSPLGELDAADDAGKLSASHVRPQLRCNACWEPILPDVQSAETCYRTSCGHLFCEKCAYKHFGQGRLQCPVCSIDLNEARGGISETGFEEDGGDLGRDDGGSVVLLRTFPASTRFHPVSAGPGFFQEEIRRQQAEEQKAFQIQHGEKYIQLKNYTDQLEAELRETKSKMQALTTSNDELREAYKEKSRKCRNWEKMCKTLKAQPSTRQFPSPTRSTMGGISMQQQDGGALVTQANQFNRPSMRSMGRAYAVDASTSSMRNSMANMGGPETPRTIQRPNVGMFDRFARPQIGVSSRPSVQPLGGPRTRVVRPKTPVQASQRMGFLSKRPTFRM